MIERYKNFLFFLTLLILFSFLSCNLSQAKQDREVKSPNVSGSFYPRTPATLSKMIDDILKKTKIPKKSDFRQVAGLICPHAGYIYSGAVAGYSYKTIQGGNYKTVIIIGPSHYQQLDKIAIYKSGYFQTPLGEVPVDSNFADSLLEENNDIEHLPRAFEKEHSIEVQIPFLQKCLTDFKIVPIIISNQSFALFKSLSETLAELIKNRDDVLVVASSDMSHFHHQDKAYEIDQKTLSLIKEFNPHKLFLLTSRREAELCGSGAVITLMLTMKRLGADNIKILKYATSADITYASKSRVVGYPSISFSKRKRGPLTNKRSIDMLNNLQRKKLLSIARNSIIEIVRNKKSPKIKEDDPALLEKRGAFVTIKKQGGLRGCIGHIVADMPLVNAISAMAIEAAIGDPRFPALEESELDKISLEISVLTPLKLISNIDEIEVGTHGLLMKKGYSAGLLLPQVATEYNWTKEEFLQHTCMKAGLPPDAWKKNTQIYIFSAEVFGEEE